MVGMKIREWSGAKMGEDSPPEAFPRRAGIIVSVLIALASQSAPGVSPQQAPPPLPQHQIVIPNRTLDIHELNELAQKDKRRRNLDAANAERKRIIDDEANRLLILARDLKAKLDRLGNDALTPTMIREAEVIQWLAGDMKEKMKLTVSTE